jgi:hypothetical protein
MIMTRDEQIEKEAKRVSYNGDMFSSFIQGAEWADKTMIDKAYEWLKQNAKNYVVTCYDEGELNDEDLLNDFKKAMEE